MYLVSPTLNVNVALCAIPLFLQNWVFIKWIVLQISVTYYVGFPSKFQSSMTIFRYGNVGMQNIPKLKVDELTGSRDDSTRKLLPKKCH